jgi:hypothetical protein
MNSTLFMGLWTVINTIFAVLLLQEKKNLNILRIESVFRVSAALLLGSCFTCPQNLILSPICSTRGASCLTAFAGFSFHLLRYTRAVWKVRGLTLLLRVRTLWRCGDGLFFEVPPLASDALFTTFYPLLKNVLQTVDHFEISCLWAPFSWLEKPRNRMGRDLNWILCSAWKNWMSVTPLVPVWWPGNKNSTTVTHACRKRRLKWVPGAQGYNWATMHLGDINTEALSSGMGVGRGANRVL